MDKKSVEEIEARYAEILQTPPYPVEEMLALIKDVPSGKAEEWTLAGLKALSDAGDFAGTVAFARAQVEVVDAKLKAVAVRDVLKKATKDRLLLSFVDSVGFGSRPLKEAFARLEKLVSFVPGARVLSDAWGLGEIRRLDSFYRRITVDFRTRKGHQFTFDAACDILTLAPEGHILVTQRADPARVEALIKDKPGEFVKEMLRSFGAMTATRLEELCAQHGFIKAGDPWKKFWSAARAALGAEKPRLVEIPTKRAEPIVLRKEAENYGEDWFTQFATQRDPRVILASVKELESAGKMKTLDAATKEKIAERLEFALVASRKVDNALYVRVACCLDALGFDGDAVAKARAYLWAAEPGAEESRYLAAALALPARDQEALVAFLVKDDPDARKTALFAVLPQMCFPLLTATVEHFKADEACRAAVSALLRAPAAPATLVTLILGRYKDYADWKDLPELVVILMHAIALGEGKQSGETLRMQNTIRRLFANQAWLEDIFKQLGEADQALFFERFQASIAWDPSTHHVIVVRMTHIVPALAARMLKPAEKKTVERITSLRSYAERKAAYLKLINVDIPKNAHDIDVARGYGDLRENFEYQSAKDEQRALMQKQTLMQDELKAVKATDFADVAADEVRPGTTVTLALADGTEKTYTVLGEWDNDLEKGILSNKARLAENMLGKKPGETVEVPEADGRVSEAVVKAVAVLSDEMRAWVQVPEGLSL